MSLMFCDVYGHLASGKLEAWGFRSDREPEDEPTLVPSHCFDDPPTIENCEKNIVQVSKWRYERVKIRRPDISSGIDPEIAPNLSNRRMTRPGRPQTAAAAHSTLEILHQADPNSILKSANRLLVEFNAVYVEEAPKFGLPGAGLSERKLQDHIKTFRQKLE